MHFGRKKHFLTILDTKSIRFCKKFFSKHFSSFFFYAEFNFFSDWNYDERFLRFFYCTEPHNRFFKKFKKPSLKLKKKNLNRFRPLFGCST